MTGGAAAELAPDERAEATREELQTLSVEIDHRVKNVLASVQAIASQSARRAASLDGFLKTFSGRLKAMASAQELLTATRWRGASIHDLATATLSTLAPGQTRWEGPDLFLTPRAANALALALHELAVNAVRHGALSNDAGSVQARWRDAEDGGFVLDCKLHGLSVEPMATALAARGVPFLFATGYGDNQGAPEGFDAPIVRKPYDVGQIAAALAALTGRG